MLIALCHTASILAALKLLNLIKSLPRELLWFSEIYFGILYHFFMVLFTTDRFLVFFYLTIKYPIYLTSKKLLKIIYMIVVLALAFVRILLVLFSCKVIGFWKLGITVIHTVIILDTLYVIDVVITYTYIFVLYKRHAKLRKIS